MDSPRTSRKSYLESKRAELAGANKPRTGSPLHFQDSQQQQQQQYKFTMPAGGASKTRPNPLLLSSLHNSLLKQNSGSLPGNYPGSPGGSSQGSNRSSPKLHQQMGNGGNNLYHVGGYHDEAGRAGSPHSFGGPDYRSSPSLMQPSQQQQQHFQSPHYRPGSNKGSPAFGAGFHPDNGGNDYSNANSYES